MSIYIGKAGAIHHFFLSKLMSFVKRDFLLHFQRCLPEDEDAAAVEL